MEDDRQSGLHPEREYQSMGLPISFGNSNSRQARAATAATRRPFVGAEPCFITMHRPPPPPPPSQLFNQAPPLPIYPHAFQISHSHQDPQSHGLNARTQRQIIVPPPPPAVLHIRPLFHQQHPVENISQSSSSHLRAKPYGPFGGGSGRKHVVKSDHHPNSSGCRINSENLFKDSMFCNPWRGFVRSSLLDI